MKVTKARTEALLNSKASSLGSESTIPGVEEFSAGNGLLGVSLQLCAPVNLLLLVNGQNKDVAIVWRSRQ